MSKYHVEVFVWIKVYAFFCSWLFVLVLLFTCIEPLYITMSVDYIDDFKTSSGDIKLWSKFMVIGDAFRIEFYFDELDSLTKDYELEALHNTVQAWIDYRPWMEYPGEWRNIKRLIEIAHIHGLPVGVAMGYHVGDSVDADYNDSIGFLHYYRAIIPEDEKWKYPNGSVAEEPYSVGASRSFTGRYVVRVLGEELGRRDFIVAMQPQNPYWQRFLTGWCIKTVKLGADMIFLDSPDMLFTFSWGGGWGDHRTWEGQGLIEHLRKVFSNKELKAMGIYSLENFDLADYLSKKYGKPTVYSSSLMLRGAFPTSWPPESVAFGNVTEILQDPVFREALIYWYQSAINFVKNLTTTVKQYAKSMGKNVLITSNEYLAWFPSIILTPYMDVIYVETNQFFPPPLQTNQVLYKMALASGNYSKPVWVGEWILWFSNPYHPSSPPDNVSNLIKVKIAEAYASGAQMLVPFGTGYPADGWPPKRLVEGNERKEVASYYKFISQHRDLFTSMRPVSDVAILVSTPTAIWNDIPALGLTSHYDYQREILGWARILESMGITYDVLILGMDRIFATDSVERLGEYKLVIAPELTYISPEHLEIVEKYLKKGGRLIVSADFAQYDQYGEPLPRTLVEKVLSKANVAVVRSWSGRNYLDSLRSGQANETLLNQIKTLITQMLPVKTTNISAPEDVSLSLLASQGKLILHLINYRYRYNSTQDWIIPVRHLNISVKLPVAFEPRRVELLSPDLAEPVALDYKVDAAGYITFTVPILRVWDIIVIEMGTSPTVMITSSLPVTTTTTATVTETAIKTIIKTATATYTSTVTQSQTLINTITETTTEVITATSTVTKMTTVTKTFTEISTTTYPTTVTKEIKIMSKETIGLAIIGGAIIGLILGYLITRRKT